jgi:hypothetical protein
MYKSKSKAPNVCLKKYEDFEECMNSLIERHVESVPPVLGTRGKAEGEIRDGMEATWRLVSPQFKHSWHKLFPPI